MIKRSMIKRSIVFTAPQMKWLAQYAKKLGITVADAVRRIIDEKRSENAEMS